MFKILDEVCTPKRGTKYSAYVDLFAREKGVYVVMNFFYAYGRKNNK